jgi:hypothetical protein
MSVSGSFATVRQSRVVLAPVAGVKPAEMLRSQPASQDLQSAGDGGKRNSFPGRARYKPSTHCAGNAGLLGCTCMLVGASLALSAHETAGASRRPAFPAPASSGRMILQTSGASRRENADVHSVVVTREGG